ncbi:hypothetical protein LCGC14_3029640, partial [marine sediment metagenome]
IQGVLVDVSTQEPIAGAKLDIGFASATTTANGLFVFRNLPPTQTAGETQVYSITIDLTRVTSPLSMAAAAGTKYPEYAYKMVELDGEEITLLADTPFTNTTQTIDTDPVFTGTGMLTVGKLAANINGVVAYDSTHQPVGAGWTVNIESDGTSGTAATAAVGGSGAGGHVIDSTVTDTNGSFTFSNLETFGGFTIHAWNATHTFMTPAAGIGVNAPDEFQTLNIAVQEDGLITGAVFVMGTDVLAPVIIAVTPEQDADIDPDAAPNVVFTFSEPMMPDEYTTGVTPSDTYGMFDDVIVNFTGPKIAYAGNLAYTLAWNTTMDQLTVTIASFRPSSRYTVDITGVDLRDENDQAVFGLAADG